MVAKQEITLRDRRKTIDFPLIVVDKDELHALCVQVTLSTIENKEIHRQFSSKTKQILRPL